MRWLVFLVAFWWWTNESSTGFREVSWKQALGEAAHLAWSGIEMVWGDGLGTEEVQ